MELEQSNIEGKSNNARRRDACQRMCEQMKRKCISEHGMVSEKIVQRDHMSACLELI